MARKDEEEAHVPAPAQAQAQAQAQPGSGGSGGGDGGGGGSIGSGSKKAAALLWWKRRWPAVVLATAAVVAVLAAVLTLSLYEYYHSLGEPYLYNGPRVQLNYTTYVGKKLPNNVSQFLGMRYAAPPTGGLRWRAPRPPRAVNGLRLADKFGPICLGISVPYPDSGQSEDCLYANVWMPSNATAESKLPVWLFIQGGGYVTNSNANWDGAEVVEKSGHNIVMVNFNYRVGLWGFLASDRVRSDGSLNVGLLDQRLLMAWVRDNIARFGGDPGHVVIHGASAGAGSVALHLTAYGGRDEGLFIGAVAESVFFPAQPYLPDLEWQFDRLAGELGCGADDVQDQMGCLRGQDTQALQAANAASPFPGRPDPPMPLFYWTPCVDGDVIEELPYAMFERGRFIRVPVVFGDDNNEGSVFASNAATPADVATFLQNNYPRLTPNETAAALARYPRLPALPQHDAWYPTASMAYGEATFTCPGINILDAFRRFAASSNSSSSSNNGSSSEEQQQIWSYRTDITDQANTAAGLGVPHLFESAAVFGPTSVPGAPASWFTYNAPMVPIVMGYWISFIRSLSPNKFRDAGAPEWETWSGAANSSTGSSDNINSNSSSGSSNSSKTSRRRLVFELGRTRMEDVPEDQMGRCQFWQSLSASTQQKRRRDFGFG